MAVAEEMRFGFGRNWAEFVDARLNDRAIAVSRGHMAGMLRLDDFQGKVFLDIGCGSGIHSLAALRHGAAQVISFDYDPDSVATTQRVRRFAGDPPNWEVFQGSVLDAAHMASLPKADIVYSWGVLHHTGDMWTAVRNAAIPLKPGGDFYIALYSSDNYVDPPPAYWLEVKRRYNRAGRARRRLMEWRYAWRSVLLPELRAGRNPLRAIRDYGLRGMEFWTDVRDWLGGWPMDFAGFAETREFCRRELGLALVNVKTGQGCTEYVFADPGLSPRWAAIEASRTLIPLAPPFAHVGGHQYTVDLPHLEPEADGNEAPQRSRLMLYEDGVMLGLAHSPHAHIARYGGGRFSHWGRALSFSASDGSDPNSNGRTYAYCEKF
jgi:SAM-dependent methyltransferase